MAAGPCGLMAVPPSGRVRSSICVSLLFPGLFLPDSESLMITGLGMASPHVFKPLDGLPGCPCPVRAGSQSACGAAFVGRMFAVSFLSGRLLLSSFPWQNMPISFSLSEVSTHRWLPGAVPAGICTRCRVWAPRAPGTPASQHQPSWVG